MIFDILLIRKLSNPPHVHMTLNKIFSHFHPYKFCLLSFKLLCSTDGIFSQLKSGFNNSEMCLNNMLLCACERAFSVTFYNENF